MSFVSRENRCKEHGWGGATQHFDTLPFNFGTGMIGEP